ncbi:hypothetical protein [Anatilimnocola floriformis]|uniref:hypothetical protein n=1 Tax=Anatilimnocola floriformis TaxID=2948575 RepID=UPI0020C5553A|nr:hypothetical protein [Anatilimnocola floriformis]
MAGRVVGALVAGQWIGPAPVGVVACTSFKIGRTSDESNTRADSLIEPSETRGMPSRFRTFSQFEAFCKDRNEVNEGLA